MDITLKLLTCQQIEDWLDRGECYWSERDIVYHGESIHAGLKVPLRVKLNNMKLDPSNEIWHSYYAIVFQDTIVGLIGPKGKMDHENSIEVGYGIGKDFRNKGIATTALSIFSKLYFNLDVTTIKAATLKGNIASQKVLTKCGFVRNGEENGHMKWILTN